jgi:hypothetical protein
MTGDATERAAVRPRFAEHPLRSFALNEIHARPFPVMSTPRLVLHYAFMTDAVGAARSREDLARRCDLMKVRSASTPTTMSSRRAASASAGRPTPSSPRTPGTLSARSTMARCRTSSAKASRRRAR